MDPSLTFEIVAEEGVAMLGIVPASLPPNPVFLRHVEVDGWATQQGVEVGDELLCINGMKLAQMSLMMLDALLRKERPLRLTLRRNDAMTHFGSGSGSLASRAMPMKPPTAGQLSRLRRANTKDVADFASILEKKSFSALAEGTCTTSGTMAKGDSSFFPFCGIDWCGRQRSKEAAQIELVLTTPRIHSVVNSEEGQPKSGSNNKARL